MESLIKAGAFDSLNLERASLYNSVDRAIEWGQRKQHETEVGQGGLFAMFADPESDDSDMMSAAEPWPKELKLAHEKETLGFYITGHPLRKYQAELDTYANTTTATLADKTSGSEIVIGGIVAGMRAMRTKKGDRMAVILLEDLHGVIEVLVFPEAFGRTENLLIADSPVFVVGKLDNDESAMRLPRY